MPIRWTVFCLGFFTVSAALAHAESDPSGGVPFDVHSPQVQAVATKLAREPAVPPLSGHRVAPDHSGRKQVGKASFYAASFNGRKMANGKRFQSNSHAAASKTLPLGTVAKVTNVATGRTAQVTVEDHGPYVDGRTIDVSQTTAHEIGLDHGGVAPVVVAPIAVPQADGSVKPGAGALPGPAQ